MSTPYLILHRVRGQPAFDIAEKCQIGEEEGWIISTSGHRAYPYQTWVLSDLHEKSEIWVQAMLQDKSAEDWPDHYPSKAEPKTEPIQIFKFLDGLGLGVKIVRRV